MEETVEVVQHNPQKRVQSYTVEQLVDVPVPRIEEKIGHVIQEAEDYRDENELDKMKMETTSGLKNHCVTIQSTSTVKELKSKFEVGHKKETEEAVHLRARNRSNKNRWRKKQEFEAKQYPQNAQERADLTNQRQIPVIRSVQKTVEVPMVQSINKLADIPVDMQRQRSIIQAAQHINEVEGVPALTQSEVPNIPDDDEDRLVHDNKKRRLPMPAEAVSESRADKSDFDRFDDLVLPSPKGKTLFMSIASGDEAEDGPEKEQEIARSLV